MLHRIVSRSVGVFAAAALGLGLAACEDNTPGTEPTPPTGVPAVTIKVVSYDTTGGPVDAVLPNPVVVQLLNPDGTPAADQRVTFTASAGGLVEHSADTTGSDGLASSGAWKLGKVAGTQQLAVSAAAVNISVTVPAAPLALHSLGLPAGMEGKSFIAGDTITPGPVFVAVDTFNNRVTEPTEVTFTALEGDISDDPVIDSTDSQGNASPGPWALSTLIGPQRIEATFDVNGVTRHDTLTIEATCTTTQFRPSSSVQGEWRSFNCRTATSRIVQYTLTTPPVGNLPNISAFGLSLQGVAGQSLQLISNNVPVELAPPSYIYSTASNPYEVNYIVPAGNYDARALSPSLADNSFTLTRSGDLDASNEIVGQGMSFPTVFPVGCGEVGDVPWFTAQGATLYGWLDPSNACNAGGLGAVQDRYLIQLQAGDTLNPTVLNWTNVFGLPVSPVTLSIRDAATAGGAVLATGLLAGAGTNNYANPDLGTGSNARTWFIGTNTAGVNGFVAPTTGVYEIIVGTASAEQFYQLFQAPPINIITTSLPSATVGTAYSAGLAALGGAGTQNWSVASAAPNLPPKFAMAATGAISGSPETPAIGVWTFTASVFAGSIAQRVFTLTVVDSLHHP